jgi:hypothetical protein
MRGVTLARLLTVKVAASAVAVAAVGGVAVAAATGSLPAQRGDSSTAPAAVSTSDTLPAAPGGTPAEAGKNVTGDKNAPEDNGKAKNGTDKGNPAPSPSLPGLCRAYTADAGADHGKALENPAFTVLITTAGGKDKVGAYCTDLLGKQPGDATHSSGKPGTRPAVPGEVHPTGKPGDVPPPHQNR